MFVKNICAILIWYIIFLFRNKVKINLDYFKKRDSFKYEISAAIVFGLIAWIYFFQWGNQPGGVVLLFACILGLYMAMNIWANDVANNMWPAVGAKAITLGWAIVIAAIFEASGAIIAGWDVVNTIKGGIIDSSMIPNANTLIYIMMATLGWAAVWINLATYLKAPVSATHSIMWGLLGAGMTASGYLYITTTSDWSMWAMFSSASDIVTWSEVGKIAISWIISPLMGWIIAAAIMFSIRHNIMKKKHMDRAAKHWLPIYVGLMTSVFSVYLLLKGLKPFLKSHPDLKEFLTLNTSIFIGIIIGFWVFFAVRLYLKKHKSLLQDDKKHINKLFNIPLIFAVALLSFAHGANDVANAIWPLVAINDAILSGWMSLSDAKIPFWIMFLWAAGLVIGLMTFGSRLITTVWGEITKLNQVRAFSVALAAAITVIIASQLGLPVSSTHIAIWGIFGVGFLREFIKKMKWKDKIYVEKSMMKTIALSWIITLPATACIAWLLFLAFNTFIG